MLVDHVQLDLFRFVLKAPRGGEPVCTASAELGDEDLVYFMDVFLVEKISLEEISVGDAIVTSRLIEVYAADVCSVITMILLSHADLADDERERLFFCIVNTKSIKPKENRSVYEVFRIAPARDAELRHSDDSDEEVHSV